MWRRSRRRDPILVIPCFIALASAAGQDVAFNPALRASGATIVELLMVMLPLIEIIAFTWCDRCREAEFHNDCRKDESDYR